MHVRLCRSCNMAVCVREKFCFKLKTVFKECSDGCKNGLVSEASQTEVHGVCEVCIHGLPNHLGPNLHNLVPTVWSRDLSIH